MPLFLYNLDARMLTNSIAAVQLIYPLHGPKYISQECREKRHHLCDDWVPRGYDEPYDHPCHCDCHKPKYIRE